MFILFYYLVSSGVPIVPFTPKNLNAKEKEKNINNLDSLNEKESKTKENSENKNDKKMLPTVFVPTSLIINPILKTPKNMYNNKYQKKRQKPFAERTGDWICKKCKNLNFAFRQECNRCKLSKKEAIETEENKEENNLENNVENNSKKDNNGGIKNNINYNNGVQYNNNFKKNKFRFKKYSYNGYI